VTHGKNGCLAIRCLCKKIYKLAQPKLRPNQLKYQIFDKPKPRSPRFFTYNQDLYIHKHYGEWSAKYIGQKLGKSEQSIKDRAGRLGITKEFLGHITVAEGARLFSCPHTRILKLIKTDQLPHSKAGHQYRILVTELEKWAEYLTAPRKTWKIDEGHYTKSLDRDWSLRQFTAKNVQQVSDDLK